MDLDSKKMDELLELTRDNNKILRAMRRTQHISSFFTFVYWMVILGSILGTYYYFQPAIKKYMNAMQTSVNFLQNFENRAGTVPGNLQSFKDFMAK